MRRILLAVTAMAAALAMGIPATAGAAPTVGCYTGCVAPTSVPVGPRGPVVHAVSVTPPPSSASGASSLTGSSSLPFTGADVIELAVIAVILIAVGWAMARRRRALG